MLQAAWTRFARKAVLDQANVKPNEIFTILTDDRAKPEIAEAVFEVGLSVTKNTQLIAIRSSHFSEEPVHVNKAVAEALYNSDVILSVCETRIGQIPEVHEAVRKGARVLLAEPGPRPDFLIDGLVNVDCEKMVENVKLFCKLWHEGQTSRITSAAGTDLSFNVGDRPMQVGEGAVRGKGELEWFPGAMANVAPIEDSINGNIAVDGSLFPFGMPEEIVNLTIKNGVIKKVYGGKFATRWNEWLESLNDEVAYHLCHISVGFNPRAELTGWTTEDERVAGAITIGFGRQNDDVKGTIKGGEHHLDIILKSVKVQAGDKILLNDNVFNSDLGFINL